MTNSKPSAPREIFEASLLIPSLDMVLSSLHYNSGTDLSRRKPMVGHDDIGRQLAQECPRRIISILHSQGHYIHLISSRVPGKVLCFHSGDNLPADCEPTPAQLEAWQVSKNAEIQMGLGAS
jgi:hypothetical protein